MPDIADGVTLKTTTKTTESKLEHSDYIRFFEAGRDAAVIGDFDAQSAHGLVPLTDEQRAAWDAGRSSVGFDTPPT